jgi:hypothetical protein
MLDNSYYLNQWHYLHAFSHLRLALGAFLSQDFKDGKFDILISDVENHLTSAYRNLCFINNKNFFKRLAFFMNGTKVLGVIMQKYVNCCFSFILHYISKNYWR